MKEIFFRPLHLITRAYLRIGTALMSMIIILSICSTTVLSQTPSVIEYKGTVKHGSVPVQNATVYLSRMNDGKIIKSAITDSVGNFSIQTVHDGDAKIRIEALNYEAFESSVAPSEAKERMQISLRALEHVTQHVTVTTKRPFIQRTEDKLILNVDNSIISSGSTALEVLDRAPGINISPNDQISLQGRTGILILIDGKQTGMSGEELANYLRSLPSSTIDRIEILTNPTARYDAAGSGGVIDIRLKRTDRSGASTVINLSGGGGVYGRTNESVTHNHKSKGLSIFGNVTHTHVRPFNNIVSKKDFYDNGRYIGSYDQDNMVNRSTHSYLVRGGADIDIGPKDIIGMVFSGTSNSTERKGKNRSNVLDSQTIRTSQFLTSADGVERFRNYVINLNYRRSIDTLGSSFSVDVDRAIYDLDWGSVFHTVFQTPTGASFGTDLQTQSDQDGNTQIHTFKADLVHAFNKKVRMESGVKLSDVHGDNKVLFFDLQQMSLDMSRSNHFIYDENIIASYLNFVRRSGAVSMQLGLRSEHTHVKTHQVYTQQHSDTSYLQLFPSALIRYQISAERSVGISVSKRIDRPTFGQLNPFVIFVDPSFQATGDPRLRPPISWSYQLNYSHRQLDIALLYSKSKNTIDVVLMPVGQTKTTLQIPINFKSYEHIGLTASYPFRLNQHWNLTTNMNIFKGRYTGSAAGTPINASQWNLALSMNSSLQLGKGWSTEMNFDHSSENDQGVIRVAPISVLSAGIQKALNNNKGNIKFNLVDILWRQWPRAENIYLTYYDRWYAKRDTRIATLSFTYRLGNDKINLRRRSTASEEERRRAGGN